jgi:hypothetical protein
MPPRIAPLRNLIHTGRWRESSPASTPVRARLASDHAQRLATGKPQALMKRGTRRDAHGLAMREPTSQLKRDTTRDTHGLARQPTTWLASGHACRRVAGRASAQVREGQESLLRSGGGEGPKEPDPDTPPLLRVLPSTAGTCQFLFRNKELRGEKRRWLHM